MWHANISDLIFDTTISSGYSSNTDSDKVIAKPKAKSLRTMTLNFQSRLNKKDKICQSLNDNNIDNILGCEIHLPLSVSTSDLLSPVYTPHWCDRDNGYGESIIIAKKSVIIKETKTNKINHLLCYIQIS